MSRYPEVVPLWLVGIGLYIRTCPGDHPRAVVLVAWHYALEGYGNRACCVPCLLEDFGEPGVRDITLIDLAELRALDNHRWPVPELETQVYTAEDVRRWLREHGYGLPGEPADAGTG